MAIDYTAIADDAAIEAPGLDYVDAYPVLAALEVQVPRARYLLNERTITKALADIASPTPYADAQAFMDGLKAAGAAGDIPAYLVDDLAGDGLDICDDLVSFALARLAGTNGITQAMVDKLMALKVETRKKYPGLKEGDVQVALHKREPGYGGAA